MKMYEMLEKILADTTNWLSFAEAKNAALIAFNGVWGAICIDKFLECKSKEIAFIYAFCSQQVICKDICQEDG